MAKNYGQAQKGIYRGIYEFEDPSGTLIAAKIPTMGTADLYDGTAIIVKPNQCAIFIYNGVIADLLLKGVHKVSTNNLPILTDLANWKFGFRSPLRCEIWFFSGNVFTARRWGTASPVMVNFPTLGTIPIRGFGNFNLVTKDPQKLYETLIGSRTSFDITDLEEFIQGEIIELLPTVLARVTDISKLNSLHDKISKFLEKVLNKELKQYGIAVRKIQVISLLPPQDVLEAMGSKAAMKIVDNQQEYLLYKAANSLDAVKDGSSNDSMQMMMGLMLGKGLVGADYHEKEKGSPKSLPMPMGKMKFCSKCGNKVSEDAKFCSSCGDQL